MKQKVANGAISGNIPIDQGSGTNVGPYLPMQFRVVDKEKGVL